MVGAIVQSLITSQRHPNANAKNSARVGQQFYCANNEPIRCSDVGEISKSETETKTCPSETEIKTETDTGLSETKTFTSETETLYNLDKNE